MMVERGRMATDGTSPAKFRLLGVKDVDDTTNYRAALLPSATFGKLDGHLAWRQHDGGHESRSNMSHFLAWANKLIGHTVRGTKTE